MNKKLKPWQKTAISYLSFFLALLIAAGCFIMLAISPDTQYGIESGIIEHSKKGNNITDSVIGSSTGITAVENENLRLDLTEDGNITVTNKTTGKIWSTAVADAMQSNFAQGYGETHSLCSITYINDKNAEAEWTAYEQSVQKKQVNIYKVSDDTVRFDFILGESVTDQLIPMGITKERFEKEILPKLSEDDKAFLKRQYLLYEADKLTAADNPDELYEKYPNLKNTPIYIAGNIGSKITKQKLTAVFDKIGYTAKDYDKDNELTGFGASSVTFTYKLCLDFTLEDKDLVVNIPKDEIVFYTEHPLLRVSLMKFLASSTDKASVLIPSGSGAIAEFVPGGNPVSFKDKIYGKDLTLNQKTLPSVMDKDSKLSLPIFALRSGTDTLTAVIESGAAAASLNYNSYTGGMNCYYDFTVLQSDKAYIDEKNNVIQCGNDIISEDITVRYRFDSCDALAGDDSVFSKIGCDYREYLSKNGFLPKNTLSEDPTLMLEILGGITVKKDVLGLLPVNSSLVLTDFEKAYEMVEWFSENTQGQIAVNLNGFNRGGLYRQAPGKIGFLRGLGGRKGYKNFFNLLNEKGIDTYCSASHTTFLNPNAFDGFKTKSSALFVDGSTAVLKVYSAVEGANFGEGSINIISPANYPSIAKDYIKSDINALSVGDLANSLNTDYSSPYYDRTRALKQVVKALEQYKKSGVSVSVEDANAYALKYCQRIENIAVTSGYNSAFAKSFPLKQIVLHGVIDYTTGADFSVKEAEITVLNAIRTGSGLKATLSYENSDYGFDTYYSNLYSSDYNKNKALITKYSNQVNNALKGLGCATIDYYEVIGEVSKTVYSDGTVIYVNTGNEAADFDMQKIDAMSYLRINN